MPIEIAIPNEIRRLLRYGSGVGIQIGASDLEIVAARVRPGSVKVLGRLVIGGFAERPAGEWGSEYARFLSSRGAGHVSATVLLPRREVIVRQVSLPGVAGRDMENAIRLQLDALHPYGEDDVAWGWSPLGRGFALVGIARRSVMERYLQLFEEAGVAVASFTFSAAALRAAVRLNGPARDEGFVALGSTHSGAVEAYGESPERGVFSAEFASDPERAAVLALAELRLPPETAPRKLEELLPAPAVNPVANDLSRNALPYATALAGACPRLAPAANLLPPERRRLSSRAMFIPTAALAALLAISIAGAAVWSRVADRRYLEKLRAETAGIQPLARRAQDLDRETDRARARALWLDTYRAQTRKDLEVLAALTRLIEGPAWTSAVDITRDSIRLQGEAPQTTALFKILDTSGALKGAKLDSATPNGSGGENFIISSGREGAK